jgi:thiosulfate/3-mercaptopyruvate sulfurtransferase
MLTRPLVSATELQELLSDPATVVVDCRFRLTDPDAGRRLFDETRIPGAVYAHLDDDLARKPARTEGRHPLPDAETFARTLGRLGIGNQSRVVVYDDQAGAIAARLWWMLRWLGHDRVSLLDGGLAAWISAGGSLAHGPATPPPPRPFEIRQLHADWVVSTPELAALAADARGHVIDARSAARFGGRDEPIDPVAGHVPGTRNWPFTDNLTAEGHMRAPAELEARLSQIGLDTRVEPVAMCGSGVTACHLLVALAVLGRHGKLYAGSWSEWIRDPARPVAQD